MSPQEMENHRSVNRKVSSALGGGGTQWYWNMQQDHLIWGWSERWESESLPKTMIEVEWERRLSGNRPGPWSVRTRQTIFTFYSWKVSRTTLRNFLKKKTIRHPKSHMFHSPQHCHFLFFVILIFIHLCPFLVYYLSCYNHRIYKAQHTTLISLLFFPFYIVKCIISIFRPFARILLSTAVNSSCAELFFRYWKIMGNGESERWAFPWARGHRL